MDEFVDILKSFFEEGLKEEEIEKAKKLPDEALKAISGALKILNKYKDVFPDDVVSAIKTLTKYASYAYPEKSAKMTDDEFLQELEKAGAKLSKATKEQLVKIKKIIDELLGEKDVAKKYGDLPEDVTKKLEEYEQLKAEKEEQLKKAKEEEEKKKQQEIEDLKKKVEELEKAIEKKARVRKGIESQDDDDDSGSDGPKWPSLINLAKGDDDA